MIVASVTQLKIKIYSVTCEIGMLTIIIPTLKELHQSIADSNYNYSKLLTQKLNGLKNTKLLNKNKKKYYKIAVMSISNKELSVVILL